MKAAVMLLMLAASCTLTFGQAVETPPFTLTVSADPVIKAGDMVVLKIKATNTSSHDMNVSRLYGEGAIGGYLYYVRNNRGELIFQKQQQQPIIGNFRLGSPCTLGQS